MNSLSSAPAKVILVGEHAVVYGKPAIALPLPDLRANANYHPGTEPLVVHAQDLPRAPLHWSARLQDPSDPLSLTLTLVCRELGTSELYGTIDLRSTIPPSSGMGSGAAVSAALSRAVAASLQRELPLAPLNRIVYEVEKLHHGNPSGIDNTVVVYERALYFAKNQSWEFLPELPRMALLVAHSGRNASTRAAVAAVSAQLQQNPQRVQSIFGEIAAIVAATRACLARDAQRQLGALLTENHRLLQALRLSTADLDALVQVALDAGALGAKLTGGGLGGAIIALVQPETRAAVCAALQRAGASQVFSSTIGRQ